MFDTFNHKFNAVASEITKIADEKITSHRAFYKLGMMISELPLKSIQTEQNLEEQVSNHQYSSAVQYLEAQTR